MGCSKWSLTGKCVPILSLLKSPWTKKAISPLATFSHKGPSSHQLFADCGVHQEHEANQNLCQALGWIPVVVKFLARLYMHHLSGPSNITSDWASISLQITKQGHLWEAEMSWPQGLPPYSESWEGPHPDLLSPACHPTAQSLHSLEALMPGLSWFLLRENRFLPLLCHLQLLGLVNSSFYGGTDQSFPSDSAGSVYSCPLISSMESHPVYSLCPFFSCENSNPASAPQTQPRTPL